MQLRGLLLAGLGPLLVRGLSLSNRAIAQFSMGLEATDKPVKKVIIMLQDIKSQIQKEGKEDEATWDKLHCWCKKNNKEEKEVVGKANAKIGQMTSSVQALTARGVAMATEVKSLTEEVAKNEKGLKEATDLRRKQVEQFKGQEKDVNQTITAVAGAIEKLSKTAPGAFLQLPNDHIMTAALTLKRALLDKQALAEPALSASIRDVANAFLQAKETNMRGEQAPGAKSAQVLDVLRSMKYNFETNLQELQDAEVKNNKTFYSLKGAKENEIAAGKKQIQQRGEDIADAKQKAEQTKRDIQDAQKALAADVEFLKTVKAKCSEGEAEWNSRSKARADEVGAVDQAISILDSDQAFATFGRAFKAVSFLQESAKVVDASRVHASKVISALAQKSSKPGLALLAMTVMADSFANVTKAIDAMSEQLTKQKADEAKDKDSCVSDFAKNKKQTDVKTVEKKDAVVQTVNLNTTKQVQNATVWEIKKQIKGLQEQLKLAGENREKENADFQSTVADQRATQILLQQAVQALEKFYNQAAPTKAAKAFVVVEQTQTPAGREPAPEGFKAPVTKNKGATGVIAVLGKIIKDAKDVEAKAVGAEKTAQESYVSFAKKISASIEELEKGLTNKQGEVAKTQTSLVQSQQSVDSAQQTIVQLGDFRKTLHTNCDEILKNFDARQKAINQEIQGLAAAKAFLAKQR